MSENVNGTMSSSIDREAEDYEADGASSPKRLKLSINDAEGSLTENGLVVNGSDCGSREGEMECKERSTPREDDISNSTDKPLEDGSETLDVDRPEGNMEDIEDDNSSAFSIPVFGPSTDASPAAIECESDNENEALSRKIVHENGGPSSSSSSSSSCRPELVQDPSPYQCLTVTESEDDGEEAIEEKIDSIDVDRPSSSYSVPTPVVAPLAGSDSEIEILSSDDEELRQKKAEDTKVNVHKAKQVLTSIKKLDIKSLGSKIKLNVTKPLSRLIKDDAKGSSDGLSPIATSSPSCASEEEDIKKEEKMAADDGDSKWDSIQHRLGKKLSWGREGSVTTENSSRCSSPCEDPLEREPEEKEVRNDEANPPREALTAESVREAALKNAAINDEYNVKNILSRLKAASLTLNSTEGVRGAKDDDGGVEIIEKEKFFCEIVLESSDEEEEDEDAVKRANDEDDDDVQVIANPNIKILEKTQQLKVAEQLSSAGVTVKNSMPKVPRKLFPKWQTIAHLAPMEIPPIVKRPIKEPPDIPKHLQRPIKVLSLFDGISGCLVALKQLGVTIENYVSSEIDEFSKIVTLVRHQEVHQVGDARVIDEKVLREHGPFDLLVGGFPCNDFENDGSLRNHKAGMHFQLFVEILKSCSKQHKRAGLSTPFHWLFYNVDLPQRHRDRISTALNCDPVKLDAIHISPMRKPDYFWSNIPGLETVLHPIPPLDRMNLQECLEPDRVARIRRLNTLNVSFESMRQGQYDQVPINHGGEMDSLWMVETERVLGFPDHYTDVANLPPKERLAILAMSGSVPIFRHILTPLKRYYEHTEP